MRIYVCMLLLSLATVVSAQPEPKQLELVELEQAERRTHGKLKVPKHEVGPTIPGLRQGAIPQGLAYWKKPNWFLISHYFEKQSNTSVVTAVDAKTGKLKRCLTLLNANGKAHKGHVGGLAVSDKYLWIGSGELYRVPLKAIEDADTSDYLRLQPPFEAECTASFVAYYDKQVWVGEFVSRENNYKSNAAHEVKDRKGVEKYAWIVGYALDDAEELRGTAGGKRPPPAAVISIRQKVQGMAFLDDRIILSMSYGRDNDSTLAAYTNPLREKRHRTVEVDGETVPLWFLDGVNKKWEDDYPPMSEGIAAYGDRFALVFESGADKYQKDGRGPIDTILFFKP